MIPNVVQESPMGEKLVREPILFMIENKNEISVEGESISWSNVKGLSRET